MINLLKNSLAKTRKLRSKSASRDRSNTPLRTPRQEIKKPVRSSSVERKDFQNLSRTSSEKSLSIDYRKLVREKVDKKTKESFKSFEKTILNK